MTDNVRWMYMAMWLAGDCRAEDQTELLADAWTKKIGSVAPGVVHKSQTKPLEY